MVIEEKEEFVRKDLCRQLGVSDNEMISTFDYSDSKLQLLCLVNLKGSMQALLPVYGVNCCSRSNTGNSTRSNPPILIV
ncbi:MAG: hypothetical protein V7776_19665 [Halopseudomonas aestusnigri]